MAISSRCGQTESAGEDCPYCGEYAISPVGAYSGSTSRASNGSAAGYGSQRLDPYVPGDHDPPFRYGQAAPQFAALPPCERPFAAERTVWPAAPRLVPIPTDLGAPDDDLAIGGPKERDPERLDVAQPAADQQRRTALREHQDVADDVADRLELAALIGHGRWIALTTAILVVLIAAAGAVTLVVHHGRTSHSPTTKRPVVTASPSAPPPASVAPAGRNQLIVDPTAATGPDEAAIVASVNRYFNAINSHNYLSYKRTFILALRGGIASASFSAEFGTTAESDGQLLSVNVIAGGKVHALVSFISQQPTAGNRGAAACTAWNAELYLGRRGGRYLLVAQPRWYQASGWSCS